MLTGMLMEEVIAEPIGSPEPIRQPKPVRPPKDYIWIKECCQEFRGLAQWAIEMGLDEQGQQLAPILMAGVVTQDTRLLHSLGGFERELVKLVQRRARQLKIWRGAGLVGNNWSDEQTGELSFLLDLMAIQGIIGRQSRRGEVYYTSLPREAQ